MADSPYEYLTASGEVIADTSQILTDVQDEYKTAFNKQDLIVTPTTPQGVLITAETLDRTSVVQNNAAVSNQINPQLAGGSFLDAIIALTNPDGRISEEPTVVENVALTGVPGTVIPVGSQAQTTALDVFESVSTVTLDPSGNATVNFQSVESGPIPCTASSLNSIVSGIIGWETVNNPTDGLLGTATQSDLGARAYRNNTLAYNGISLPAAATSALYATTGVTSLSYRENIEDVPMGALISVTGGTTLSGTIWGMTTTSGSGTDGAIVVGTDSIDWALSAQNLPAINPWPVAAFSTTGNVALTGLGTQSGGDWASALTAGNIVLVKNQTTDSQNGLWVAASGAWSRQATQATGSQILGSNDGISMKPNSVYACVAGGLDTDVAAAMLENKSSGAGWNGNTAITVKEPASGQNYIVRLDRPAQIEILVKVYVRGATQAAVQQAVVDYAQGNIEGLAGFIVGADVSPFELGGAIVSENPGSYVQNVEIALGGGTPSYSNAAIPIGLNQQAFTTVSLVQVIIIS